MQVKKLMKEPYANVKIKPKTKKAYVVGANITSIGEKEYLIVDVFINKKKYIKKTQMRLFLSDSQCLNVKLRNN